MEITVKLYGNLRKFGNEFKLIDVQNTAEALNALYCQLNGFRMAIQKGLFNIKADEKEFTMETLRDDVKEPLNDKTTIHILPIIAGSGGVVQAITGAVLVVVGFISEQYYLVGAGLAMIAGGVAQMLTKTPSIDQPNRNETEKKQSTSFSNLQNLVAQGRPVPLAYGRILVGSLIIGKGVETLKVELYKPDETVNNKRGFWGLKRRR
jgi:predicted phage tail protein